MGERAARSKTKHVDKYNTWKEINCIKGYAWKRNVNVQKRKKKTLKRNLTLHKNPNRSLNTQRELIQLEPTYWKLKLNTAQSKTESAISRNHSGHGSSSGTRLIFTQRDFLQQCQPSGFFTASLPITLAWIGIPPVALNNKRTKCRGEFEIYTPETDLDWYNLFRIPEFTQHDW